MTGWPGILLSGCLYTCHSPAPLKYLNVQYNGGKGTISPRSQVTCFKFCENIYSTKSFIDLIRIIVVTGEEYES